jgi:hypothetical protein
MDEPRVVEPFECAYTDEASISGLIVFGGRLSESVSRQNGYAAGVLRCAGWRSGALM